MSPIKEEAIKIITNLPDDASWEDVMYEFYAKQKIQKGEFKRRLINES